MSRLIAIAAFSGAAAVAAGAFGAHGAAGKAAEWLRTGAQYEMAHAVAALAAMRIAGKAAAMMLAGSIIFAITLYAMALGAPLWLGAVTPIGGLGMIVGWVWLGIGALKIAA